MNINQSLYNNCRYHFLKYDCLDSEIYDFLFNKTTRKEKQNKALNIIDGIIKKHHKGPLLDFLISLGRIEYGTKTLDLKLRDHIVHAVMTYLLGIYLNEKMMGKIGKIVEPFQWKIACLFHDIAYPVEVAHNINRSYCKMVNTIGEIYYEPQSTIMNKTMLLNIDKLIKRNEYISSFNVIGKWLKKWKLNIKPNKIYDISIKDGNICHGMLSALTILFLIDKMYQKNNPQRICTYIEGVGDSNWDETYFNKHIIPACAAIFIHNIDKEYFSDNKIDPQKAPIAFLLRLCDSLQEWERPSNKKPKGEPPYKFDLRFDNDNHLIYYAKLSREDRNKIESNIKSVLAKMEYFKIHNIEKGF